MSNSQPSTFSPQLPKGFKQTEVGVIPEDWDVKPLGHLIKLQAGYSFRSENFSDIGIPVIRISDIQDGIVNVDSAICHPPFKIDDDFVVKNGDFLVAMSGATTGKVGIFHSPKTAYQNQRVGRFVVRDETRTSQPFVGQLVRSSRFGSRLSILLEQGAQPNVSGRQIESLLFPVPSQLPEQRAIATALSDVDGLLGGLDRLIAKKRGLKAAAMQQLLTGHTRLPDFCGEWQVKRLGELAKIQRGASPRPIDSPVWFNDNSSIGWVRISDVTRSGMFLYETTQRLSPLGVQHSRPVPTGSLIMSICATVGRPIITKIDVCIHDGFVVFDNLQADQRFLYYMLKWVEPDWSKHGQTGSQMNLNTGLITGTPISLPPIPEQTAIAEVLTDMDAELAALEQRREKTRALKQAMMQELLAGRTRLVARGGAEHTEVKP
jgi:type I restriction enzyme S subunit